MQTAKHTHKLLKKLFGVVTAGAFAALPLASVIAPAQAQPGTLRSSERRQQTRTLEGVVTIDRQSQREFILRLNNGQRVQVRTDEREPRRLSSGDRVRVEGSFRRNQPSVFRADRVQILDNQNNNANTFNGRVTNVESDQRFDINVNGTIYNVMTSSRLPRRLNTGDYVRVFGRRSAQNDIVNATVVVINNDDNGNNNNFRTFTGRVTNVNSDQRFDIVVNGMTYNVTTSSRLPRRLNTNDSVRVYGRRAGDNDIVNATVVIINNVGNNNNNDFRTFTGRVTDVDSDQRFDINVNGMTYNVMTSSRLPRGLDRDDDVRVYGRRSGSNDIINATVIIINNR